MNQGIMLRWRDTANDEEMLIPGLDANQGKMANDEEMLMMVSWHESGYYAKMETYL